MDAYVDYDDYWTDELSRVMTLIGPDAIPQIAQTLAEANHDESTRIACTTSLEKISQAHPEYRDECVRILTEQLAKREGGKEARSVNGFLVSALVALNVVEAAPVIEAAFAAGVVDELVQGDWPHVRYDLGLGPKPSGHRYAGMLGNLFQPSPPRRPDLNKLRKNLKIKKAARKQNRKRR
jgi:hypothetical protein